MRGETVISAGEFEDYFRLLWLLVVIVMGLMALLFYLLLSMRRAREGESRSMAFSSLIMEGQEEERRRIAAELHDSVLPELRGSPSAARIREICGRLMPPDFTRFCLRDALISLCEAFVKTTGIECVADIKADSGLESLRAEHRLHLYRIVQEALTNTGKHSLARRAVVVVRPGGGGEYSFTLSVSDDGRGGALGTAGGLGLRIMRQRAAILGARIEFISEAGNGLMVCVVVPLPPPPPPGDFPGAAP